MTPFTDEEAEQIFRENAAFLAAQLGMREETDPTRVWDGQPALLVSKDSITLGTVVMREDEMRTARYTTYSVNSTHFQDDLYENRFAITEAGWAKDPETTVTLREGLTLYVGY